MTRHLSPAYSPSSLRYLAASDFDLIVGGAGKQDIALAGDAYLPGGGGSLSTDIVNEVVTAPPMTAGAADGAGFTWPDAQPDTVEQAPAADADALVDGEGPPHMCGTMPPVGDGELAVGDDWADTLDPGLGVETAPATDLGVESIMPYEVTEQPTDLDIGLTGEAGDDPYVCGTVPTGGMDAGALGDDWAQTLDGDVGAPMTLDGLDDIMPYEVTEQPVDGGPIAAIGEDEGCGDDDDRGGCGDDDDRGDACNAGAGDGGGGGCGDGNGGGDGGGCGDEPGDLSWTSSAQGDESIQPYIVTEMPAVAIPSIPSMASASTGPVAAAPSIVVWAFGQGTAGSAFNAVGTASAVVQDIWNSFSHGAAFRR